MDTRHLKNAERHGFVFEGAKGWIEDGRLAAFDSALATLPGSVVPAEVAAYIDPTVIEVLTRPMKAREIFSEVKKGDWTTSYMKFQIRETTGSTEPYSDYGQSRTSGVNYHWEDRENYLFQTVIEYGDMEQAVTAAARISLASDKQIAAATVIDADANNFYLFGVAGKKIYGLLNDPSLAAPIAPAANGEGGSPCWEDKNTSQIYDDILTLFQELVTQTKGLVDQSSPLTMVVSPALSVKMAKATDFNVSVPDMLHKYFTRLKIVTLPEMSNQTTGETVMLIADEVRGQKTGELAYTEKVRAGRLVPGLSGFSQKWVSGTCGALIYQPFAIVQMRGM